MIRISLEKFYPNWFVDGRFRIPISCKWLQNIPQPRWLKRWYYRKSFEWWDHPSNHHWKMFEVGDGLDCFVETAPNGIWKWWRKKKMLLSGERDLWDGCYYDEKNGEI
jgi:hypothetical protein